VAASSNAINTVERLGRRIACNQAQTQGFSRFMLEQLDPRGRDSALDIGPGLGAQLIPVAKRVRRVVGVDVSPEIVAALRSRAAFPNVAVIAGDMDDLAALDLGGPYSLVYAVYSLHYSRDPGRVVQAVAALLGGSGARFVTVTPDVGNNAAWFADLGRLYEISADVLDVPQVGRRLILPAYHAAFRSATATVYQDRVRFPTLEALMLYYDACAPYCRPDQRAAAQRYFGAKIDRDGEYEISKHSLAVVGH